MEAYTFFRLYNAVNMHCKDGSTYDFFKYNGNTRTSEESFNARRDKYFFQKFCKYFSDPPEAIGFFISNLMAGNKHITSFEVDLYKTNWAGRKEACEYEYTEFLTEFASHKSLTTLIDTLVNDMSKLDMFIIMNYILKDTIFNMYEKTDNFSWNEIIRPNVLKYKKFYEEYFIGEELHNILVDITRKILYK